ncbi:hypothetical protein [Microlunatus soli]|nr:hypothetical protein [Microlunatus soli]
MINTPAADTPGSVPAGLDAVQVLRNVGLARRQERAARTKKLIMATCWADCQPPESIAPHQLAIPGRDRPIHDRDGIPEQTGDVKLGPLARREHNSITHGPWNRRQPQPGTHLFRAPHGKIILVNETGNHGLGQGPFAHRIWQAAAPQDNAT